MKKKFTFRKVTALILSLICVFAMSATAFAAEMPTSDNTVETNAVRATQTNEFTLNSNSDTATLHLTRNVVANSTQKTYQVVKTGSNCVVVVRLVNQSTGKVYTMALTANGGEYTEGIGVTIPAGYYTVSFASTPCTVSLCWCVFKF